MRDEGLKGERWKREILKGEIWMRGICNDVS